MTADTEEQAPNPPVEELVFLARSPHRVQLLTQLSTEKRSRRDIQETTGISQPTLGRILGDFEQRHWISNNHDGTYALTPLGAMLADTVDDLLCVLETIGQLQHLCEHLPLEQLEFDLKYLTRATITTPTSADPLAHMRRFDELAAGASTVKMVSNVLSCAPTHTTSDADRELFTHVDEIIVTEDALTSDLDNAALREWLNEQIEDGHLSLYKYDGSAEFLFGIFDTCIGIVPIDGTEMPCGLIESGAEPIREWATDLFDVYQRRSTRTTLDSVPV